MGEVLDRLKAVKAGTVSFGAVVEEFRGRDWDTAPVRPEPVTGQEALARTEQDVDPVDTDLSDIATAYYQGFLTQEQYATLYHVTHAPKATKAPQPSP